MFARRFSPYPIVVLAFLGGCATPRVTPPTLTAETGASAFEARSLSDPGLHRYLRENLGHDVTSWDFDALCWVGFYFQPALELTRAQWATARAAIRTAGQTPNPTLTLTPGYDFTHQDGVSPWMPSLALDYLLSTAGKGDRLVEMATEEAEAARQAIVTAAWKMRSDLRKALAEVDAATRRERMLQQQAEVQQHVLALLEQRVTAGAIASSEATSARTALLRAEAAAADAKTQLAVARVHVAAAVGLPMSALENVTLPPPPAPATVTPEALTKARQLALRSRADVLAALAKYASAQHALELELAKRIPDVHIGPGYQWDQGLNKWSLGISFELPILHQNQTGITEAVSRRAEAAAQFNVIQAQAVAEIDAAIASVQAATAQVERARQLHDALARQTALAGQRRQMGAADALEVATADLDANIAENAVLDARIALAAAEGDLEDALQLPFPKMSAVLNPTPGDNEHE